MKFSKHFTDSPLYSQISKYFGKSLLVLLFLFYWGRNGCVSREMTDPGIIAFKLDKSEFSYENFLWKISSSFEGKQRFYFHVAVSWYMQDYTRLINLMCDDSQPRKLLSTRHTVIISTLWLGYCEENSRILTPELFVVDGRSWGWGGGNSALSPSHRSVLHGALRETEMTSWSLFVVYGLSGLQLNCPQDVPII